MTSYATDLTSKFLLLSFDVASWINVYVLMMILNGFILSGFLVTDSNFFDFFHELHYILVVQADDSVLSLTSKGGKNGCRLVLSNALTMISTDLSVNMF